MSTKRFRWIALFGCFAAFIMCGRKGSLDQNLVFDRTQISGGTGLLAVISPAADGTPIVLYSSDFESATDLRLSADLVNNSKALVVLLLYAEDLSGQSPILVRPAQAPSDVVHLVPQTIFASALGKGATLTKLATGDPNSALVQAFADEVFVRTPAPTPTPTPAPTPTPTPAPTPYVTITYPLAGSSVSGTVTVTISYFLPGGATQEEFCDTGNCKLFMSSAPEEITWDTTLSTVVERTLTVRVCSDFGCSAPGSFVETSINVNVCNHNEC